MVTHYYSTYTIRMTYERDPIWLIQVKRGETGLRARLASQFLLSIRRIEIRKTLI